MEPCCMLYLITLLSFEDALGYELIVTLNMAFEKSYLQQLPT
jgi:hypothetical protein